MAIAQLS